MTAEARSPESHAAGPHATPTAHAGPGLGSYLAVFVALLVLTAVTTTIAFIDLGRLNVILMLVIAVTKATLVVLVFMHVAHSPALTKLVVLGAVGFLVLLVLGTLADHLTRGLFGF